MEDINILLNLVNNTCKNVILVDKRINKHLNDIKRNSDEINDLYKEIKLIQTDRKKEAACLLSSVNDLKEKLQHLKQVQMMHNGVPVAFAGFLDGPIRINPEGPEEINDNDEGEDNTT